MTYAIFKTKDNLRAVERVDAKWIKHGNTIHRHVEQDNSRIAPPPAFPVFETRAYTFLGMRGENGLAVFEEQ